MRFVIPGAVLIFVLAVIFTILKPNQQLPKLPYRFAETPLKQLAPSQTLIIGNGWVKNWQRFWPRSTPSSQLQFFNMQHLSLRRIMHLLKNQNPNNLPKTVIWLGSDSEIYELAYPPDHGVSWLLSPNRYQQQFYLEPMITGTSQVYPEYFQLANYWELQHMIHLRLFQDELKHFMTFLQKHHIRFIAITTPTKILWEMFTAHTDCHRNTPEDQKHYQHWEWQLIHTCDPKSFTPLANEILRNFAEQYGYILYDWDRQLRWQQSASTPLNKQIIATYYQQLTNVITDILNYLPATE